MFHERFDSILQENLGRAGNDLRFACVERWFSGKEVLGRLAG
jgi:hypothetical protein